MPNVQHIYKFAGPPTLPPPDEGHHWVDTLNNNIYLSKGASVVNDWILVGSGGLPSGGTAGQILIKQSGIDGDATWNAQPGYTDTANTLAGYDSSGNLGKIPDWTYDNTTRGLSGNLTAIPNNGGGSSLMGFTADFEPAANSPSESWNVFNNNINIDPNSSGFTFGTTGNAVTLYSNYFNHPGTSDIGAITFFSNNFTVGNGTDPISVKGINYAFGFGAVSANVTVNGPIQGYGFQPNVNASAAITQYTNAFYDFSNFGCATPGYTSFASGVQLASISNNTNYTGVSIIPAIPTFTGNAGFTGYALGGALGTFGTGGYQGVSMSGTITSVGSYLGVAINPTITTLGSYAQFVSINPTITTAPNGSCTGIFVNMSNCSGTGHQAANFTGDVQITGNLSFTGALSIGALSAFASQAIVNGGGVPGTIHSLVSNPTIAASTTVSLGDTIGVNTAMLLSVGDNAVVTTALVGLSALALPAVVTMGTGSTVDQVAGATFALSLDGAATGGTIANLDLCRSVAIPNGITTVTKCVGYKFDLPFGDPGTTTWGIYASPTCHNYLAGDLLIGGTAYSDDVVTNSSIALEIKSTTKAFMNARMTTTERNALTAVNGMQIYNSTTDKLQVYAAGSWVDLH